MNFPEDNPLWYYYQELPGFGEYKAYYNYAIIENVEFEKIINHPDFNLFIFPFKNLNQNDRFLLSNMNRYLPTIFKMLYLNQPKETKELDQLLNKIALAVHAMPMLKGDLFMTVSFFYSIINFYFNKFIINNIHESCRDEAHALFAKSIDKDIDLCCK
jgi:hypothetical protein